MAIRRTLLGAGAIAAALTVAVGGNAFAALTPADTNTSLDNSYVAVGSDTADDIMQALSSSSALTDTTGPLISSYRAVDPSTGTSPSTIRTKSTNFSNPNCSLTRPNGSTAGQNAIAAAITPNSATFGCIQIARSSSNTLPTGTGLAPASLTYIPYAVDSVSYATIAGTNILKNANLSLLRTIYTKNGVPGTTDCGGTQRWAPLLPQAGSGTRNFWASLMGISTANRNTIEQTRTAATAADPTAWGSCVRDRIGQVGTDQTTGTPIQEHDGTVLTTAGSIVPFSTAQWIAQGAQVIGDKRGGRSVLNAIDFDNANGDNSVSPFVLQQDFKGFTTSNTAARRIYNIVETAKLFPTLANGNPNPNYDSRLAGMLVGPTSTFCANATVKGLIQRYGFDLPPLTGGTGVETCGSTALQLP